MKVQLPQGIASISGTISRSENHQLIAKTYNKTDGTQETRFYMMPKQQRTTPLSDKEKAQRARFAQAAEALKNLTPEQFKQYATEGKNTHFRFNGKQYSSPRGYILARLMKEL